MARRPGIEALIRDDPIPLIHPDTPDLHGLISYALDGPIGAPAVTLIPGGSGSVPASALTAVWRELSTDHRVLTVETRGAPSVAMGLPGFDTRDLAEDVVRLLDWLRLDKTFVVGASIGSMIAQHVAAALGERCSGAILALSTAGGDTFFRELALHLAHLARVDPAELPYATSLWAAGGGGFDRWAALLPERAPIGTQPAMEGLARRYEAAARHDARDQLRALRTHALVISAADDLMLRPALGRDLAERLPSATFELWDDSSHMCINEDAARFAARCRAFLSR